MRREGRGVRPPALAPGPDPSSPLCPCHQALGAHSLSSANAGKASQWFGGISHLSAVDINACCLSQLVECTRQYTGERATFPTYLPTLDIDVGKRVLPPVLLKRLLLLTLDGLGIIVLINPFLRSRKGVCFGLYHRQLFPISYYSLRAMSLP